MTAANPHGNASSSRAYGPRKSKKKVPKRRASIYTPFHDRIMKEILTPSVLETLVRAPEGSIQSFATLARYFTKIYAFPFTESLIRRLLRECNITLGRKMVVNTARTNVDLSDIPRAAEDEDEVTFDNEAPSRGRPIPDDVFELPPEVKANPAKLPEPDPDTFLNRGRTP